MSTNSHQMSPSHHFSAINTKVSIVELGDLVITVQHEDLSER